MAYDISFSRGVPVWQVMALRDSLRTETAMDIGIIAEDDVRVISAVMPNTTTQNLMRNIIDDWESLALSADKTSITANDSDAAVISWSGSVGDVFDYVITMADETVASGLDNSVPFQITFTTDTPGAYLVKVSKRGTYLTGFIQIEAV